MIKNRERRIFPVLYRGIIACTACCLMAAVGFQSLAAKEGRVTINSANVRSEASQSSESLGKMPAGTTFTVSEETVDAENNTWYHIEYTLNGEQKTGWMRSDVVEITSEGEPEESIGEISVDTEIQGITLREPESMPELSDSFSQSQVNIGGNVYTAMAVNGELTGYEEFYLVYGEDASGMGEWYLYDAAYGTLQRNVGQFTSGGSGNDALLQALQKENQELKEKQDGGITIRNYIILGAGALCLILLIVVIVLAVKMSRIEFIDDDDEYDDDDDEYDEDEYDNDDDEYDDEEDEEDEDDISWMEIARAEKRAAEEKKKKHKEKEEEPEPEEPEEWDDEDIFMEESLEEQDDGLDEYFKELREESLDDDWDDGEDFQEELWEKKPAKRSKRERGGRKEKRRKAEKVSKAEISEDDFDDSDDFDIEIVDLDDLDL